MDLLPLIPRKYEHHDISPTTRRVLQEVLNGETIPPNVVDNTVSSEVDTELSLKPTCQHVLEIKKHFIEEKHQIQCVENKFLEQHGSYLVRKSEIENICDLKEILKLKRCEIFTVFHTLSYGIIRKPELYRNALRQFLDFQFNTSRHLCDACANTKKKTIVSRQKNRIAEADHTTRKTLVEHTESFKIVPSKILFHNYQIGVTHQATIKLINTGCHLQYFSIKNLPKNPFFFIDLSGNKKVASGMSVDATIIFVPRTFKNFTDKLIFKDAKGHTKAVEICCQRDPPILLLYILNNVTGCVVERKCPGNPGFDYTRCTALNETIDCGSVLVGDFNYVTVILTNSGEDGEFFITTEREWCREEFTNVTDQLELKLDHFWIYPTYFNLKKGDVNEIYIVFEPVECGLQIENLYLICNNNSYKQLELVADSVGFSRNFLSVDILPDKDIHEKENHCIFLKNICNNVVTSFTITVHNKSSVCFRYYWELTSDDECILGNWLRIKNDTVLVLAPYSTTDFIFEVEPHAESDGYYKIFISLFVMGIPPLSLKEDRLFRPEIKTIPETTHKLDIMIMNSELACYVESSKLLKIEASSEILCECSNFCDGDKADPDPPPKLKFSCSCLDFGILPIGIDVRKSFSIKNVTNRKLIWRIDEVKYDIDCKPYMELVEQENISKSSGILKAGGELKNISYQIKNKGLSSRVSILILFSIENEQMTAESICMVTYEISEYDIRINTKNSSAPILCPMQLVYPNVPVTLQITIENYGIIPGCFYFLRQIGNDSDKIKIEFNPQSDTLKSKSSRDVNVTLTCKELGILEDVFVPCFVGGGQEPILMRVLCAVDTIHVFIFLPIKDKKYQKVIWPPKILFEYDDWSYCACGHEECYAEETDDHRLKDILNENDLTCGASLASGNSSEESDLIQNLEDMDPQLFLQDKVVELHQIDIKKSKKISVFIENLTPVESNFTVRSNNFPVNDIGLFNQAFTIKYKNTDYIWEQMASDNGIVIQPNISKGILHKFELLSVDIWVYASTWGTYIEEIMIDIGDIPCFSFTFIVEIVGTPIQFPISTPSSLKCPVIRLGSIAYGSQGTNRELMVKNISSIPMNLRWYTFLYPNDTDSFIFCDSNPFTMICDDTTLKEEVNCILLDNYYGRETTKVKIWPRRILLEGRSSAKFEISIDNELFEDLELDTEFKCYAVGLIFIGENDRFKSNYFYRKTEKDLGPVVVEITFTLVQLTLTFEPELIESSYSVYANDIIFQRTRPFSEILPLRNNSTSDITARIQAESPLTVYIGNKKIKNELIVSVPAQKCLEVTLKFNLDKELILGWSHIVYHKNPAIRDYTNIDRTLIKMTRLFTISYLSGARQEIPFDLLLHYPKITVRPTHLKMNYVLVGCTKKLVITVFNLTGSVVKYEVYKTCPTEEILTRPNFGEIGPTIGLNKSSVNIFVYFTPKISQMYQETIRVMTNIPQYFIDVPIKGYGSNNEKFYTDLKL